MSLVIDVEIVRTSLILELLAIRIEMCAFEMWLGGGAGAFCGLGELAAAGGAAWLG